MSDDPNDKSKYAERARMGLLDCLCPWAYKSLGKLYGIMMGEGWVRMSTVDACPHHGTAAQSFYKTYKRWPKPSERAADPSPSEPTKD